MLCHCLHYILFGTWVIADTENIWNDNSGNNALQCWTIKNIEAQHIFLSLEKREMRKELDRPCQCVMGVTANGAQGSGRLLIKRMYVFWWWHISPCVLLFSLLFEFLKSTEQNWISLQFWLENSSFTAPGWCRLLCSCASEHALSWLNSLL